MPGGDPQNELLQQPPFTFTEHMRDLVGRRIQVATQCGTLEGTLREVFPDHILITVDNTNVHILLSGICFVGEMRPPMMPPPPGPGMSYGRSGCGLG